MRVGLMGGAFDPIHVGHLRAAENAREALGLDKVLIVPVGRPPHRAAPHASCLDRFAMTVLATAGHPGFCPSDLELTRDGPSYTVDTVARLREQEPEASLFVIVGADNLGEIPTWKDPQRLLEISRLAVVGRPGGGGRGELPGFLGPDQVAWVEGTELAISSRDLRARVRDGRSIRYLVPTAVAEHIERRGLYR